MSSQRVSIPWGPHDSLDLDLPGAWNVLGVNWPDLSGPIDEYPGALDAALSEPLGMARIEELVSARSKVAIVVDDPSRWTPVREALPGILDRLRAAGVADEAVSISAGVGRHHAVDDRAMRLRVGDAVVDGYRCYSPPVDDLSQYEDLGSTPEGVPVRVFRPVAQADLRILIGSVLPHLQAGFGGGYKLIFPGTSHRSTLSALHRQGLGGHDAGKLLGGDPAANPMRKAIRSAATFLGPCLSISHLLGPPGTVLKVCAGTPDAVQGELAVEAKRRFRAGIEGSGPADVVIAGNNPWPGDPMQSFKVLLQHRAACRRGGVQIGLFWTDPVEIDRSFPMPAMKAIAATGAVGGWFLRKGLAAADGVASAVSAPSEFLIRWARELVVDRNVLVYAPPLAERIGSRLGPIRLFLRQEDLWDAAGRALPSNSVPTVRVFPQGGLTYAPEPEG